MRSKVEKFNCHFVIILNRILEICQVYLILGGDLMISNNFNEVFLNGWWVQKTCKYIEKEKIEHSIDADTKNNLHLR